MKQNMEEEISISVTIAERPYRLRISRAEETNVRKAVALIEQRIREYSGNYAFKDRQDLLAMVALQYTTSFLNADNRSGREEIHERLKQLDSLLGKHLQS
ncbi:MAG TPA: cell division protein ZapA [Bacteroidales bacterium]|nr:cell division protein ZapA [Bacteroidales bacterium]